MVTNIFPTNLTISIRVYAVYYNKLNIIFSQVSYWKEIDILILKILFDVFPRKFAYYCIYFSRKGFTYTIGQLFEKKIRRIY